MTRGKSPDATANGTTANGIYVSGSGTCSGVAGSVEITFAILTTAPAASQTVRENTLRLQQIGRAFAAFGIQPANMQTVGMTMIPIYGQPASPAELPPVAGYRLASSVRVVLREARFLGELLDAAAAAGAHVVQSVSFAPVDEQTVRKSALESALEDARGKAGAIAAAIGKQLGEAVTVVEDVGLNGGTPAAGSGADAANWAGGGNGLSVQARVQVMFRLAGGL